MRQISLLALTKSTGGIALYNKLLLTELRRIGVRSHTLCLSENSEAYAADLNRRGLGAEPVDMARYSIDLGGDARVLRRVIAASREQDADVIVCHGSKSGFIGRAAGRITGRPVVYRQASMPFQRRVQGAKAPLYWALDFAARGFGGHVVTLTDAARQETLKARLMPPERVSVIRTGVDVERFRPAADRAEARRVMGLDPDRPVVGWMGRIEPQKAPLDYVEALRDLVARYPHVQFVLAGEGRLQPEVEHALAVAGLAGAVRMLGWQSDPVAALQAFDVYVLSSHWEGLPITLLEAMACGCCCISTDVDGCSDALEDGVSGRLVGAGDTAGLARALNSVLHDPDLRNRYASAGRHRAVTLFDKETMVAKWVELLSKLTAGRAPLPVSGTAEAASEGGQ
ncbi:glycosyltransferase [Salipiger mangrovisoli]|uniref:Glycosyltransferase n=1 Tax=Salipiger mangrovisoli TaxID=2865933 RepID=A0ABR9X6W7_9RHOB|nr:glycosyltransferase [Salipiger mangrovisoli]MBE9639282.1 glycosyltransferase [Salipiger mangrovisoli]